jgi:hypothetical protein
MTKDTPFGFEYSKKFHVGDLVEWSGWGYDNIGGIIHNKHFGVILSIETEFFNGRYVLFAKVFPAEGGDPKKFIVFAIRKRQEK